LQQLFSVIYKFTINSIFGRAMAQVVSIRPLTAEARVRARASPRGMCSGQTESGTGTVFFSESTLHHYKDQFSNTFKGNNRCLQREPTPWRQNPQVHHRIHKSPPPAPILSQLDPLYNTLANLLKIHSDPILPSTPLSSKRSPSFRLFH
jgi:hypothetical protein